MRQTCTYRGCTITVRPDELAESPNDRCDDSLFLVGFHRDFYVVREGFEQARLADQACLAECRQQYHTFLLRAYIHSGVALSLGKGYPFNCPWDSMWVGMVFVERTYWATEGEAERAAQSLVAEWNDYLSGNVWWFETEDAQGRDIASCGGIYGDIETAVLPAARLEIDAHLHHVRRSHLKRLKAWIRHGTPLATRKPCPPAAAVAPSATPVALEGGF